MSVQPELTIAVPMPPVITPRDHLTVPASQATLEMEASVQVNFCCPLSVIVRVRVVLKRTAVVDTD